MPIQLIMFENRMEIRNLGGIYGRIRIDQLGKVQPDKTGDTRLIWLVIALAVIFVATFAATYYNRRKSKHHGA